MSHASVIVAIDETDSDQIESLVSTQMEPFDENGECFRDGSRWDWWQIGGRFSGKFLGEDVICKGDLSLEKLQAFNRAKAGEYWDAAVAELKRSETFPVSFLYGFDPREVSRDERVNSAPVLSAFAFLRNLHWHEGERMGWFGGKAKTECEIANPSMDIESAIRRCKTKDKKTGACVVTWNEHDDLWKLSFFKRFIEPLPDSVILVNVDYHV